MCYSVSLRKTEQQIEERFNAQMDLPLLFEPFYYQSGFDHANLFIITQEQSSLILPSNWGFIPEFAVTDIPNFRKRYNTLNAKSETVFSSKTYKESIKNKRCLIIADGFFEPHHLNGVSYPHFCHYPNDSLFAFAGIYSEIDSECLTCSIITTTANPFFETIHNVKKRMPLVLDETFENEWLRHDLNDNQIKDLMNVGFTSETFEAYPISKDANKPSHFKNTPGILQKISYPELSTKQGNLFD